MDERTGEEPITVMSTVIVSGFESRPHGCQFSVTAVKIVRRDLSRPAAINTQ